MTISLNVTGSNSAMIEYSNDTWDNMLDLIDGFVTSHGWTKISDDASGASGMTGAAKAYKSLNNDGVTEKQIIIGEETSKPNIYAVENFNPADSTYENLPWQNNDSDWQQDFKITIETGRLHVFCTNRWLLFFNVTGTKAGSLVGNGFSGVVELTKANEGDNTPDHFFVNSYLMAGRYNTSFYGTLCPVRTFQNIESAAAYGSRICTPVGCWGRYGSDYSDVLVPNNASPFGATLKHQIHEMTGVLDLSDQGYVKGRIFGIKVFTTNGAVNGDIFTVKCGTDFFMDPSGTDTEHFVVRNSTGSCFGIPV